ncbi:MAG: AAA family ATPase, partial [Pseudomonadota bacterium]|nr:AAA family ATPase [Pseudomonadota bacterium]
RGLKERYEVHHGVDISDSAIIGSAKLSQRYITDRQLPDKAIDLIDEAASLIRMEIDSKPEDMDKFERRLIQLKIEQEALKKDDDPASQKRKGKLAEDIETLEREYADLEEIWKAEKATLHGTQSIKSSLEKARNDIESARRGGDLARMSEIQYGVIPSLERKLEMAAAAEIAEKQLLRNRVTEQEIADVVSRSTGIPISKMLQGDKQRLLDMESFLQRRVIGQKEALTAVSNAVRRSRSGLSDPNRPNGVFLFLGPTGVGKTELCKTLAEFLFDSQDAMLRIDMSEFMEQHSVARLIGAPPGYVGYEEGGYLTEGVRRRPYSLLLLDEVEKAHPDVFNILLQVMDDGRLTDGHGRTVDFRNTIIVMTSNLGSDRIQEMMNQTAIDAARYNSVKKIVMGSVVEHFSPEFVNRIDETVVFHPLQESQIREIAEIQINLLRHRLAQTGVGIQVNNEVLDHIAKIAYDPVYGARQLKRAIQNWIENPLAQEVLKGAYFPGDTIIIDLAADNELRLSKAAPELDKEVA